MQTIPCTDQIIQIISQVDLFNHFTPKELQDLGKELEVIQLQGGETIIHEGEPGNCLYVVVSGRLRVFVNLPNGEEQVVGEIARNESVGEMAILTGEPRSATVRTLRASQLVKLTRESFNRLIDNNPNILFKLSNIIIRRLKKTIHSPLKTDPNVENIATLAVIPLCSRIQLEEFTKRLSNAFSTLGSTQVINKQAIDSVFGEGSADSDFTISKNDRIVEWMHNNEQHYRFIIYEADGSNGNWTNHCIQHADIILLAGLAKSRSSDSEILKKLKFANNIEAQLKKELVLVYEDYMEEPSFTMKWLDMINVNDHHHVRWNSKKDLERLARRLTGRAIGVVLGGGGARGFAHFGVLKALGEAQIPVDIIGGTSFGSYAAALYAMGLDYKGMLEIVKAAYKKPNKLLDYTLPMMSFIKSKMFNRMLLEIFGHTQIEDLWLKYFCVSTSLTSADLLVHQRGALWAAVRASGSLPGIAPPLCSNGELLVDGAILDNLPVVVMKDIAKRGPVLAVDVSGGDDIGKVENYGPGLSGWKILYNRLNPFSQKMNVPNIFGILMRTAMLRSVHQAEVSKTIADFYLSPPLENYGLMEFKSFEKIIEVGYNYTIKEIEKWKVHESKFKHFSVN